MSGGSRPRPPTRDQRPAFHFTPPSGWLNDPNGLIHLDGVWHLFYQHHPYSTSWGPMHWGHAVSVDLTTWEHLPVALAPDERGAIFSGTVVVDREGSAGYGRGTLLAFYTIHLDVDRGQALAYSHDGGRTWTKHPANPILVEPELGRDQRDPKVLRYTAADGRRWWVMVLAAGHVLRFYRSEDLLRWTPVSTFGAGQDPSLGVFETPDLFQLPLDGGPDRRWVLSVGHVWGGPAGGSGSRYVVGSFDGETFRSEFGDAEVRWSDQGADFYAAQSWTDAPDERRIWIGWMSNGAYAGDLPDPGWRGMMSTPRELTLAVGPDDGPSLRQRPVAELAGRRRLLQERTSSDPTALHLEEPAGLSLDVELVVPRTGGTSEPVTIDLRRDPSTEPTLSVRVSGDEVVAERRGGDLEAFSERFASRQRVPLPRSDESELRARLLVDAFSVEIFVDDGSVVITDLAFPGPMTRLDVTGLSSDEASRSLLVHEIARDEPSRPSARGDELVDPRPGRE